MLKKMEMLFQQLDIDLWTLSMQSRHLRLTRLQGHIFGFKKFESGSEARDGLQIAPEWSDARLRGEFDTLQIIDDIQVPLEKGGAGPNLEPITKAYPEYGKGGYP